MPDIKVIDKIRTLRLEKGLTCGQIGREIGLSRQRVQVLVNKHHIPKLPEKEPVTEVIAIRVRPDVKQRLDNLLSDSERQDFLRDLLEEAIAKMESQQTKKRKTRNSERA